MRTPVIFAFCLFAMPASADPSTCATIDADLDRLACYDREVGRTPKVVEAESHGEWEVEVSKSAFEDTTEVYVGLAPTENVPCDIVGSGNDTRLILRCSENATSIFIATSNCHLVSGHGGNGRVDVRLDSEPSFQSNMDESTDNKALGLWSGGEAIPFIKRMIGKETMLVRFSAYNQSPVTAEFKIAGLEEALKPLRESCGW